MAIKAKILPKFPAHLEPRDVQKNALLELEANWDQGNVFIVNLPVASGKSAIAMTLARWLKKASIITPNKLLVNQYSDEYPSVHVLRAKGDYWCSTFDCPVNKRPIKKGLPKTCKAELGCKGCTQYLKDLRRARVMPYLLSNYYIYMAHKLYRDTLIVDEAHQLISTLKNMAAKRIWHHQYRFPSNLRTRMDVKAWVNKLPDKAFNFRYTKTGDSKYNPENVLLKLKEELNSVRPKFLVRVGTESHRGEEDRVIVMEPLDIREEPPFMWPSSVKNLVLMSATISRKDIEQLGLSGKKLIYIEADSPITAERRPITIPAEAKSMAYRVQDQNIEYLVNYIEKCADYHSDTKGLIHVTYGLAEKLRKRLSGPRYVFHDRENKMGQYQYFRDSNEPKILIASGMYEGIDLPYDAGRWQVLAKVPWPSLADPAIKYMAEVDEEYYAWETIKTVLQGCGRICRTPEDYGVTYIFDSTFERLYNDNLEFFPLWFQNSVSFEQE